MKRFSVVIFILLHLSFLLASVIYFTQKEDLLSIIIFTVPAIITTVFYSKYSSFKVQTHEISDFLLVIWTVIGALSTFLFHSETNLTKIISASLVGLVGAFIPSLKPESSLLKEIPPALYCGAFVGMTSVNVLKSPINIGIAGVIASSILILTKHHLDGFGGKLGSIAFGSVVVVSLVIFIFDVWSI